VLIRDAARLLARHAWVERRLFEVVGGWAADTTDGEVAGAFAALSHHCAWHAELLEARGPLLHDVERAPASPELVAYLDAVAASADDDERLVALVRVVLPDQLAQYEALLTSTTPVSDAPVIRAVRLVVADEQDDWRATGLLLRSRPTTDGDRLRLATHQSNLDLLLPR
jgi:hypothetical protein